jgi:hypothetical protein
VAHSESGEEIKIWCNIWLSRGGCLVLIKSILKGIPMYWLSLAWVSKGVLETIRKIVYKFIWSRDKKKERCGVELMENVGISKILWRMGPQNSLSLFKGSCCKKCVEANSRNIAPNTMED